MTEKIPQHSHCAQCGRAFIGEDRYCSDDCKGSAAALMKKRKKQLLVLYGATIAVLILALLLMR